MVGNNIFRIETFTYNLVKFPIIPSYNKTLRSIFFNVGIPLRH